MPYSEDELLPISGLQHVVFCERRCALIHNEQSWSDNYLTVKGTQLHQRVHEPRTSHSSGVYTLTSVPLRSLEFGLYGVSDMIEIHGNFSRQGRNRQFCALAAFRDLQVTFVPVEFKHGKPQSNRCDEVQLCAQGLCISEMVGRSIDHGYIFYGQLRRRIRVEFSDGLVGLLRFSVSRFRQILTSHELPPAIQKPGCRSCSLQEECMPDVTARGHGFKEIFDVSISAALAMNAEPPDEDL